MRTLQYTDSTPRAYALCTTLYSTPYTKLTESEYTLIPEYTLYSTLTERREFCLEVSCLLNTHSTVH